MAVKARLTRETVLWAALELVDRAGLDALSMRSLAKALGVEAMSLYNHVTDKADLLDGIAELVLSGMTLPARTEDCFADVRALAFAFRDAAVAHPQAFPLLATRQLGAAAALRFTEAALAVLRDCGLDERTAVHMLRSFVALLTGSLIREVGASLSFSGKDSAGVRARTEQLAASGFPAVRGAAALLASCDHDAEYAFGVDALIRAMR
ncbi:TetR/AcrR family transcriptional regulator C-terminal domain-containing protein [Actinokineospora sp.]|uniref:TetR/AcrR family transcriptional regulator C-terminal domain-containing protein n=1 Tax=Actinokineospora sp. TaxID=1872133 RepID=UPI00403805E4